MGLISSLIMGGIMGGLAAKQASDQKSAAAKAARIQELALQPKPPTAIPETDQDDALKKLKRRGGRADTILTGDLVPTDIGKKTLLG